MTAMLYAEKSKPYFWLIQLRNGSSCLSMYTIRLKCIEMYTFLPIVGMYTLLPIVMYTLLPIVGCFRALSNSR